MERLPAVGQVSTYAVQKNSGQPGDADFEPNYVTDSASAATAWASGVKTYNAALGVDAKGEVAPTLMELAKQAGYRTGNVSTAEITDATPAGQMSHALARGCQGPTYSAATCQDTAVTGARSRPPTSGSPRSPSRSPATAPPTSSSAAACPASTRPTRGALGPGLRRARLAHQPDRGHPGRPAQAPRAGRSSVCSTRAT